MSDGKSSVCTDDCVVTITQARPGTYTIEHRYKAATPDHMRTIYWAHAVQWWYIEWTSFHTDTDEEAARGLALEAASTFAAWHHERKIPGPFPNKMVHSGMTGY